MVWVTGISGAGKSSVCEVLRANGHSAFDGDADGFNRWVRRSTGEPVEDAPHRPPPGWLEDHGWMVRPELVRRLARDAVGDAAYLCASVENEVEVWEMFDAVVCLVIDDQTLRRRLATRTTNHFGKYPDELEAALKWNRDIAEIYNRLDATIVDASQPLEVVVAEVVTIGQGLQRDSQG